MGKNITRLGRVVAQQNKKTAKAAVNSIMQTEFGVVDKKLGLIPDSLRQVIAKGDYMVDSDIKKNGALKPNSRVLICWAGFTPVIVSIVEPS